MNNIDFVKIMTPAADYYGKSLTGGLAKVYFNLVKDLDAIVLDALLTKHMSDPNQGMFWPTFAHLMAQAGTESDTAIQAGIDFDKNTGIDGTGSFDRRQESQIATASRRKKWIERAKLEWKETPAIERLINSPLLESSTLKIEG